MRKLLPYFMLFSFAALLVASCKKEEPLPHNPYDDIDYGDTTGNTYVPDPDGITGIYENILRQKCSLPGCHDGHFEPDFRSIQSAWSTMVYQGIVKNTPDSAYSYRVMPNDTGASMFWYRVTRGDAQLQRMPATGNYLTADELTHVRNWILGGAKDMFGNYPILPNNEPQILGYVAYNQNFTTQLDVTNNRLDSVPYHPFKVDQNTSFNVIMLVDDDSTAVNQMQVNQLKMSLDKNNFAGSTNVTAYYLGISGFNVWVCPVNSGSFAAGDTVYMRYYVNDGDHAQNTEFPRDDNDDAYKTYAAFYVKP
jgi:hypothetical protein